MSTLQYILFLSIPYYVQIRRRVNPTAAGGGGGLLVTILWRFVILNNVIFVRDR